VLKIGLTGGIASGKSEAARMFAALGAAVVDTDVIAREVVTPGSEGLAAVLDAFGESVLAGDGSLDRRRLRTLVFGNPQLRARLEAILHPLIRTRAAQQIAAARGPYVLVVVPLLVETDFAALVDRILVVDCPRQTQLQRVIDRDGVERSVAEAMLTAQTDRTTRLQAADDVIDNSGSLEQMQARVAELHRQYAALARDCRSQRGRAE
jgi:dephospho-CoA kinase